VKENVAEELVQLVDFETLENDHVEENNAKENGAQEVM
jgi:hypothetical protein